MCKSLIYPHWNVFAALLWGGVLAAWILLRSEQIDARNCGGFSWNYWMYGDMGMNIVYYVFAACTQYCMEDARGTTSKLGQRIHLCRMLFFLPMEFIWMAVGGILLGRNGGALAICLWFEPEQFGEETPIPFVITGAGVYIFLRLIIIICACCMVCCQCCAMHAYSKRPVSVELGVIPRRKRACAARPCVKCCSKTLGIKQVPLSALVGDKLAEEHFRRVRNKRMRAIKRHNEKVRDRTRRKKVLPKGTPGEADAGTKAGALDEFDNYQPRKYNPTFPLVRPTYRVRPGDVNLKDPFKLIVGPKRIKNDLAASYEVDRVVAAAAARVAARLGPQAVGVAARRGDL